MTEQSPTIPYHKVEAVVNVTVKEIPEEAVDKSGSIRFSGISAEEFVSPDTVSILASENIHFNDFSFISPLQCETDSIIIN